MLVVVAAVVTNGESQKPRLKCSRSPLHRAAASPLQATPKLSRLSALEVFLETLAQRLL